MPQESQPAIADVILVVEDEGSVRTLLMGALRGQGFIVLGALDGEDALRVCAAHSGSIHLLVTDYNMPQMDGRELIRRATVIRPKMKMLCITGHLEKIEGMSDVEILHKPVTLAGLLAKVHELLSVSEEGTSKR